MHLLSEVSNAVNDAVVCIYSNDSFKQQIFCETIQHQTRHIRRP